MTERVIEIFVDSSGEIAEPVPGAPVVEFRVMLDSDDDATVLALKERIRSFLKHTQGQPDKVADAVRRALRQSLH